MTLFARFNQHKTRRTVRPQRRKAQFKALPLSLEMLEDRRLLTMTPTIVITPTSVTYDGHAQVATAEAYGVGNIDLGPATVSYDDGSAPIDAGTYGLTATFAGNADYSGTTTTGTITITQATPTVDVVPLKLVYDGNSHGTTAEAYGVNGEDLGPAEVGYSSGFAPGDAGKYTAIGMFDGNNDYTSATGSASIIICQATPTVTVVPVKVTYDGNSHGTTAEAFGVNGEDLGPAEVGYSSGFAPGDAGKYTAIGMFDGNNDYTSATGSASIIICQATATVTVVPVKVTYDGNSHGTTAEAFGVNGEDLGPAEVGYSSGFAPGDAGKYTAIGMFDGTTDYPPPTGSASIIICQATATVTVVPVKVTYDGNSHGTTAEAFGVNGEDLGPAQITYDIGSAPIHAGTFTATGSYAGNNDYNSAAGTASIVICQAMPTVTVVPVKVTYDGNSHGTTAEAPGVNGQDLGTAQVTYDIGSAPIHAGTFTATGSYAGNHDYIAATGTASIIIGQATPTVTVVPVKVTYDGSPHGTTAEATGVNGQDLGTAQVTYDIGSAPIHAGTFTATGSYAGNNDYIAATGTASIIIGQATPTVTVVPVKVTYDGNSHGTTAEATGVNGEDLGPATVGYSSGFAPGDAGTYTAIGMFAGNNDYTSATGTASIVICQATPTVIVAPVSAGFDGFQHGTTAEAFGVNGEDLGPAQVTYSSGTVPTHAGTFTATGSFAGNNDYIAATGMATITIAQATPVISWSNPSAITNPTPLSGTQLDATTNVAGTFVYSPAAGTVLAAGAHTLSTTFTPTDTTDYTTATASVTIQVNAASSSGPGITVSGTTLIIVGGNSSSDQILINPTGSSNNGSTGVQVIATLNGVNASKTFSQPITTITITEGNGNENIQLSGSLTVTITAGNGNVNLSGGNDNVTATLGNGNDNISLGNGVIFITAGHGNDNVNLGNGNASVTLGNGNDNVSMGNGNDAVAVGIGNDNICLGNGSDAVTAGNGNDNISLGNGNDAVTAGNGNDNISLGNGNDAVTAGNGNNNISLGNGTDAVSAGSGRDNISLGNGNDAVSAGDGNDNISLGNGNDIVTAGNGNDNISLGNGKDAVTAGNGNDNINLGNGNEAVTAGDGNDNISLGNGTDTVTLGNGKDNISLGNGNDAVTAGNGNTNISLGNGNDAVSVGDGNDNISLGNGSDVVTAGNGNVNVNLGNGNNTVTLGNGNDNSNLGNGSNVFVEGTGNDNVNAGNGNNMIVAGLGQHSVQVGNGRNILIDGSVKLNSASDSLRQVLNDWVQNGSQAGNAANIRSRLTVTDNTSHANRMTAGSGLDWFWAMYAKDTLNKKSGDLLN